MEILWGRSLWRLGVHPSGPLGLDPGATVVPCPCHVFCPHIQVPARLV